ncbi:MAG: hypothetical protein KF809_06090 [Chloroflexi bacterium]|nr:hypothetical protein [Chloroflexota bacterium]
MHPATRIARRVIASGLSIGVVVTAWGGPVVAQDASPSAAPTSAITSLGARTMYHEEAFEDGTTWSTTTDERHTIEYRDGWLHATIRRPDIARWSYVRFHDTFPVIGLETDLGVPTGGGRAGLICGDIADPPALYFGMISDTEAFLGVVQDSQLTDLVRSPLPSALDAAPRDITRLRLECGIADDGTAEVALWHRGTLVAHASPEDADVLGPFYTVGIIVDSTDDPTETAFDVLDIRTGSELQVRRSALPASARLVDRLPEAMRDACAAAEPDRAAGQVDRVTCALTGDMREAELVQYTNRTALQAAFDAARAGATTTGTSCTDTASHVGVDQTVLDYTGWLACFPDPNGTGLRFLWTDHPWLVLGTGISHIDGYADVYQWWADVELTP